MAAAHAQRVQAITDTFRLAGATAPDRARSLAALALQDTAETAELARAGVLVAGDRPHTWYFSEAAAVARRDVGGRTTRRVLVVALLLTAVLALLAGVLIATRRT
jgi:hypothetical protein